MTARWKRISTRTARPLLRCNDARQASAAMRGGVGGGQSTPLLPGIPRRRVDAMCSAAPATVALMARCLQQEDA
jgi:hypothetical protein